MECVICKNGSTKPGHSTITLEKSGSVIVFKEVPAHVCENCGRAFYDAEISGELFKLAQETIDRGVEVQVRHLMKAS